MPSYLGDFARIYMSLSLIVVLPTANGLGACDPLVPEYCTLPFPNSFFTASSKDTKTGTKVNISMEATPVDIIGRQTNPAQWNTMGEWNKNVL